MLFALSMGYMTSYQIGCLFYLLDLYSFLFSLLQMVLHDIIFSVTVGIMNGSFWFFSKKPQCQSCQSLHSSTKLILNNFELQNLKMRLEACALNLFISGFQKFPKTIMPSNFHEFQNKQLHCKCEIHIFRTFKNLDV